MDFLYICIIYYLCSMINQAKIYGIICPISKSVKYVGKTHYSLKDRLSHHISNKKDNSKKRKWILKLLSQNMRPEICLLEIVKNGHEIDNCEKWWINKFGLNNLLNENIGGGGGRNGYNKNKYILFFEVFLKDRYSESTVKNYLSIVSKFIKYHKEGRNPFFIRRNDIVKYLELITDANTKKIAISALKNFYSNIIKQPQKMQYIKYEYKRK